ncbi:RagB/SusD family nutrient uptake outer membrane protein [Chitinophaga polysaccharea]|uniref:RagB/SusD family nutrient uptake outer membrane protein n=1 Tax=Chitinophaga polysaccharea TaxID=1293035 RepID=UPI00145555C4|nr:RagB/SusD family nutrient uptake outer membrane protein [Chitinophaga polysaccharea]NLR60963.1 RagB/SusD family nutrient uptake outer membrane protein [Chitinophaga polysaccharea]
MKKTKVYISAALLALGMSACTKLDEKPYSVITADNFYHNREEVLAAVLRPFTHANAWAAPTGQTGYWRLQELSADQLAWPQKGRHGYDGGNWIRLHNHTWIANDDNAWNPWRLMFWGMGFCNNSIADFTKLDFTKIGMTEADKVSIIAETKVLRAWHYLKLMDLYGNIPIVTEVGIPETPPTKPRKEVFAFIEKEIKDNVEQLKPLSADMVGRVTKAGAYAMLVELYLNAKEWSGTERWDDCITYCNKIIAGDGGSLSGSIPALEPDIFRAFANTNATSPEDLFQIAYDFRNGNFRFGWNGDFWHYRQRQVYNVDRDGNNGIVVIPTAYDAFKDNDLRKQNWMLIGPQKKDPALRTSVGDSLVLGTEEYNNKPLVFVKEIRRNSEGETGPGGMTRGEENSGARFAKYLPGKLDDPNYWGNDFVLYRLTEIYYNKAEALMRKAGGVATQEAVDLINTCKKRAFKPADWPKEAYTTSSLTMDELLAERGREFIFEGKRRTDLIRFNKFTTATWWDHQPSADKYKLFPIPFRQMSINPNLVQNDGY